MRSYWPAVRFWANHMLRSASGSAVSAVRARIIRIGAANSDAWVTLCRRACSTKREAENADITATLAPTAMAAATE